MCQTLEKCSYFSSQEDEKAESIRERERELFPREWKKTRLIRIFLSFSHFFPRVTRTRLRTKQLYQNLLLTIGEKKVYGAIKKAMKHEGKNLITKRVGEGK